MKPEPHQNTGISRLVHKYTQYRNKKLFTPIKQLKSKQVIVV